MDNLKAKKRHPEEIAVYTAIYVCAAFSVLLLLGIIIYVFAKGARRVNWAFLYRCYINSSRNCGNCR